MRSRKVGAPANSLLAGIAIGDFPELLVALAQVKKAAARVNGRIGDLPADIAAAIVQACDEIIAVPHHDHFHIFASKFRSKP